MNTNPPIPNGQPPFERYNFALLICGQPNSGKSSFFYDQLTRPKHLETPSGWDNIGKVSPMVAAIS